MSLSLQKSQLTKRESLDTKRVLLPCPECGQITMKHIRGTCKLQDGTVIMNLEHFQCSSCKANFFDDTAMEVIGVCRKTSNTRQDAFVSDSTRRNVYSRLEASCREE
ncbi:MAG: hypothetical protein ABIF11_07180 [Nitrospirota bacterium]